jgi:glycerate 2-kinase
MMPNFIPKVRESFPLSDLTRDALAIWMASVDAVRADRVISSQTEWDGRWLKIADQTWDLKNIERIVIVGAGKATAGMLLGLLQSLARSQRTHPALVGWINIPEDDTFDPRTVPDSITVCQARPRGSNEPTERVVSGSREIMRLVRGARDSDCVIALISGGGSALLCDPLDGVSLTEKVELTRVLSARGANIEQLNSVRRCISNVKGGGLARACGARHLITCIISDVLGDPLEYIASGPTILNPKPDPARALAVLDQLTPNQFACIRSVINMQLHRSEAAGPIASKPRTDLATLVLANNATAVDAAGQKAVELGYRYWMRSERKSEGDAEELGRQLVRQILATVDEPQIDCLISGGEPTVTLPPPNERGRGGRNQQLALSVLQALQVTGGLPSHFDLAFVSGGTDGEDGPTEAAGAFVDRDVYDRMQKLSLSPESFLRRCDANRFFEQTGGLITTGPTNTNVCDVRVALIRRPTG